MRGRGVEDMDWKEALAQAGVDVPGALGRFCNNEALMLRFIKKFPQDQTFAQLREAVAAENAEDALTAVHTLKGVAGNLGFARLFAACSAMTEALRRGDDALNKDYQRVRAEYDRVLAAVAALD